MPLVVPGVTNESGDLTQEWMNKLVGKTLSDEPSSETVSLLIIQETPLAKFCSQTSPTAPRFRVANFTQCFCKKDLPQQTRIIEPGMMVTKDFNPDRLNVHVKEDGTVSHVSHG